MRGRVGWGGWGEALDEARDIEPGGVQRLNDVMARGGEESRLRQVGGLGGRLCFGEFSIEVLELDGALQHPPLKVLVGAGKRFGGRHAWRDIGKRGHDAAV